MATPAEYTIVANAILKIINGEIATEVPGWAQGMIPDGLASSLADACSKTGVDALDAYRTSQIRP